MASELKPCAHCKGAAELDYEQPFCAFPSGKLEKQVAIYCTECDVHMSMCYSDHPEFDHDQMAAILTEKWNTRPAPAATDTGLVTVALERYDLDYHGICGEDAFIGRDANGQYVRFSQAVELLAAERAEKEKERLRFEGDLDKWMKIIGAGITGYQPEAYALMDFACEELVKLRADNAAQAARIKELEEYAREATKAITGLTGGGSENFSKEIGDVFTADLPYCLERIRERYVSKVELKRIEAKLAAAEEVAQLVIQAEEDKSGDPNFYILMMQTAYDKARAVLGGKP